MPSIDQLNAQLDRLAALDASPFPVVSLYLNLQPDQHGRDNFEPFLRKELADRLKTYPAAGPERQSLNEDAEKIRRYMASFDEAYNGLALFACSTGDLFETIPLAAPIGQHRLYISDQPHLYPLARILDEYPRYAALVADTHQARIFVFAVNTVQRTEQVESVKTRRHKMGGWAQARYQRHIDNYHVHHAKEVADKLAHIVRDEAIDSVVLAGDEVIVPLLKDQLPKDVSERIIDIVKLDVRAPEREVLEATLAALKEKDAEGDRERADALIGAYRANGLAVIGVEATARAFDLGQVDELLITAASEAIKTGSPQIGDGTHEKPDRSVEERVADELIVKARQTSAKVRFIEDPSLLAPVGGVGAFLRFKV